VHLASGRHLAISMIPVGGASRRHPALFVIKGRNGQPAVAILSTTAKPTDGASTSTTPTTASTASGTAASPASPTASATTSTAATSSTAAPSSAIPAPTAATAFPFQLPAAPGPGGTQALAVNTTNGGVKYDVAYSLVTVTGGAPVTETNSAFAIASCKSCTTVAVSFQVILIVGTSDRIAPINGAGSLNYNCPACITTALADQLVVTLSSTPSPALIAKLTAALQQLNALPSLGAGGTPAAISSAVSGVQHQIDSELNASGLLPPGTTSDSTASPGKTSNSSTTGSSTSTTGQTSTSPATTPNTAAPPASSTTSAAPPSTSATTTTAPSTTTTTSSTTTTTSSSGASSSTTPSGSVSGAVTSTTAAPAPAG
jgi:putative peptide zinc metalloprotease protein